MGSQRVKLSTQHSGPDGKESACNAGDRGLIPALGRSPGEGKGYLFQYSGLETSMDCLVHGVAKSHTRLMTFTFKHGTNLMSLKKHRYKFLIR